MTQDQPLLIDELFKPVPAAPGRVLRRVEFIAQGNPKAMPRPKAVRIGNFSRVYNPATADDWKTIVRNSFKAAWDGIPFQGPVMVGIWFFFTRPKGHFNKKGLKANAPQMKISAPDVENLAKSCFDALTNSGAWRDDAEVSQSWVEKRYSDNTFFGAKIIIQEVNE